MNIEHYFLSFNGTLALKKLANNDITVQAIES